MPDVSVANTQTPFHRLSRVTVFLPDRSVCLFWRGLEEALELFQLDKTLLLSH